MSDTKSECLPGHFSSDISQASLIYHSPSGRPRRNMQRHKFRTSTIRKTCPARQAVQQSRQQCSAQSISILVLAVLHAKRSRVQQDSNMRMQFVRNFVKRMNSSTVSWKDTHLLSKCSKCLNLSTPAISSTAVLSHSLWS